MSTFGPTFKARTRVNFYIQSEDILTKRGQNFSPRFVTMCTVLTLSLFHNLGVGGPGVWMLSSLCTCQACSVVCEKCPHFECVIHRFVLALNAGTNTLYTRVYIVSSLWMPGQVGGSLMSVWLSAVFKYSKKNNTLEHIYLFALLSYTIFMVNQFLTIT